MAAQTVVLVSLSLVAMVSTQQTENSLKSLSVAPELRCQLTMDGLLEYYWKSDPIHKKIQFLFVCGEIGRIGTAQPGQCSCYSTTSCVNCYRWWSAIMIESVATYGLYMGTHNYSHVPAIVYSHSPYNSQWNPATSVAGCSYIDDFLWYGIAYLRVYDWLQEAKWLNYSLALYDWAWKHGWEEPCGGFVWSTCSDGNFKFSIQLLEAMHFASKLAHTFPNETRFYNDSLRLWDWFFSFDEGYGLMSEEFLVSTGAIPSGCCNSSSGAKSCVNSGIQDGIYSQGLLLSSAAYLYLITGNKTFIDVGIRAFEAVVENYTRNGVMIDERYGFSAFNARDSCYYGSDPGGNWFTFNGIFMLHLGYFTELLVKNGSMPATTFKQIVSFVQNTSNAAWSKSAMWPPFDNKTDICLAGSSPANKNSSYPKFHWWWGEDAQYFPLNPPDSSYFFHKTELRCHAMNGNDTQIWEGQVASETQCMQRCDRNVNCSKYLWQTYEDSVSGINCWIWSYNRSNHLCDLPDSEWNVGIKRQKGDASCAGKCDSSEPQKLLHGVCYCDTNCSRHLDCCKDYAETCRPKQTASCKGQCNKTLAQPILGGGYCWCFDGCNPGFTGGSCCSDYQYLCHKESIQPCLDGRSQGSAINLFLAHTVISKLDT